MTRPKSVSAAARSGTPPSTADVLRSEQAYEQMKSDIVACVLRPGENLTEKGIGERYRIRKATIRAALARLAQEGLVRSEPRRGYVIAPLTLRDVNEIFDVRCLIEPEVFGAAASAITDRGLEDLKLAARKVLKPETLKSRVAFLAADRAFRLALAELSGNLRLARLLGEILDESERALHLAFQQKELLRACEVSEVSGVVKLARSQCRVLKKQVIEALLAGSALQHVNLQGFA
jgi:DNA-binding GntR family transcriptional regulator